MACPRPPATDTVTARASRPRAPGRFRWLFLLLFVSGAAPAATDTLTPPAAAIAAAHPLATEAGFLILDAGGNAFDAAIAVAAALAVVEPHGSGLGGGGFWLLHEAASGRQWMLDARERAPLAAQRDLYLDAEGRFQPQLALDGPLAAAIPGLPAALAHLARQPGRLPLAASLAPAIALAREGFAVDAGYRDMARWRLEALRASPAAAAQFLIDGEVPAVGARLRQPDLAATLETLARQGHAGFYAGELAARLVAGVREAGGIWTLDDLAAYQAVERDPIVTRFGDWRILSAAPPSSGGVLLTQMLHMLDALDAGSWEGTRRTHALVETMRRAYRDRARYLGDPDQVAMPLERLTHPFYAAGLIRDFEPRRATVSRPDPAFDTGGRERWHTTHFSILDQDGNRVAATLSINYPFGSGFVPPGTGVLLNDEMDDFAAQPGVPNVYGLIGGEANAIAPGKRMLSSMTPTFVEGPDRLAILGTPGGSRIVTTVLQAVLAVTAGATAEDIVAAPRFHHQYLPDRISFEPAAFDATTQSELRALGHVLEPSARPLGNLQLVLWEHAARRVTAASDPRGQGAAVVRAVGPIP